MGATSEESWSGGICAAVVPAGDCALASGAKPGSVDMPTVASTAEQRIATARRMLARIRCPVGLVIMSFSDRLPPFSVAIVGSCDLRHSLVGPIRRLLVTFCFLAAGQLDLVALYFAIRNDAQQVRDTVEPRAAFVVRIDDVPRCGLGVGGLQHRVPGAREVIPAAVRIQVHGAQLPNFASVVYP